MRWLASVVLGAAVGCSGESTGPRFDPRTTYRGVPTESPEQPLDPAHPMLVAAPSGEGRECSQGVPCSLLEAKARAAALSEQVSSDVVVLLNDGMYRLAAPLRFTEADSGKHGNKIIWAAAPDARPMLSGAIRVTGWELSDAVWRSKVDRPLQTRQLYVDGVRAAVAQGTPPVELFGDATGYTAADLTYASWRNPAALEFVYVGGNGEWTETRCRVAAVDGTRLTMAQPCWNNATNRPALAKPAYALPNMPVTTPPTRIENALELMQEGQWYLDEQRGELFYRAPPGVDVAQADVELPVLEQLIVGDGAHDLEFRGLDLAHATWLQPSTAVGFADLQANITVTGALAAPPQGTCQFSEPKGTCPYGAYTAQPAAVSFRRSHNITFVRNRFSKLGATALAFTEGSRFNRITGNVFRDISGGGITIGDTDTPQPSDDGADESSVCAYNTIDNNLISEIGAEYHGAVGILLFVTQHSVVANNEIHDVPYTGISSGAVAGHANVPKSPDTTTSFNRDNTISHNLIYRYLTVLNDGGAIYLEGHQNETVYDATGAIDEEQSYQHGLALTGNVVFHQGGKGNALYNDIGSQWIVWRDNIQWHGTSANGGCLPVGHIHFIDNYHSDPLNDFGCGKPIDFHYDGNVQIPRRPSAEDLPSSILKEVGLQPAFWDVGGDAPHVAYSQPSADGTTVLIAGSGFSEATQVAWGNVAAESVEVISSNFLVVRPAAGADFSQLRVYR